jgi:hypothetical protein
VNKIKQVDATRRVKYEVRRVGLAIDGRHTYPYDVMSYENTLEGAIEALKEWREAASEKNRKEFYIVKVTNMFVTHYEEEKF